jgi:outer membrane protein assembly factor BamB
MSSRYDLTDDAIQAALTPAPPVRAPSDLADSIRATIEETPQRRRRWPFDVFSPRTHASVRIFVLVALVGLLLLMGLLLAVGSRRTLPAALLSDVAMYHGGPGRTGVVAGPGPVSRPAVAWQASVGGPIAGNMPAVIAGVVYVADGGGGVEAYGAVTGDLRWKVTLDSPVNTSPAQGGGLLVVGDAAGDVVALDIRDGSRRWTFATAGEVRSSAAIVDGIVYIGSADRSLYALDLATGAKRWAFDAGGAVSRSPAVDRGVAYVGAAGGIFSAVDTTSGKLRWQKTLGPGQISSPAVDAGVVVVSSGLDDLTAPHIVFVIDALSGNVRQQFPAASGQLLVIAALGEGSVFAAGGDGDIYAIDLATGAPWWTFDGHGSLGSQHESVDALADRTLFVAGGDQAVYALDVTTGTERWRQGVTGHPDGIAVVGDRAYVGTDLGKIVAIGVAH